MEHTLASAAMAAAIFVVSWLLDAEQKPRRGLGEFGVWGLGFRV